ncbi:MAG: putative Ig domain-containing protein [Paludibaculum sp.]
MRISMRLVLALAIALPLAAQTQFYVPTGTTVCLASASNATPIVVSTSGCDNTSLASATPAAVAHGWTNGTVIVLAGVEGNTAANGTRVVQGVTATTAQLYTLGGSPVAGNGAFLRYTAGAGTSYPEAAAGTLVTLKAHPRVWLDGPSGSLTSTLCTSGAGCKGVVENPAFAAMKTAIDMRVVAKDATAPDQALIAQMQNGDFGYLGGTALMFQTTGSTSYRDKAIAILNNLERYTKGFGCVSEQIGGCADSITLDYSSKYAWNIAQAYSIVRGSMSPSEKTAFAGKILNDVNDGCTNRFHSGTGTVNYTLYGTSITGTGTQWLTNPDTSQRIAPGDSIAFTTGCTSGYCTGMTVLVSAVTSDTSLTLQAYPAGGYVAASATNAPFWIAKPWIAGNCGLVNFINHSGFSPLSSGQMHPSIYISGLPTSFGGLTVYSRDESNRSELYNQNITKGLGFLALGLALADDDVRAQMMIQRLVFWWKDYWYPLQRQWSTGAMQITAKYFATRVQPFTANFAIQLRNSFVEPAMDFTGGTWLKTPLSLWVYGYNRAANSGIRWGGAAPAVMTADHWKGGLASAYLQPGALETPGWYKILKDWTGFWGPAETEFGYANLLGYPDNYLYTNPTATTADPATTLPLARNLTVADSQPNGEGTGLVISRTGWSADSSILEVHALSQLKFSNLYGTSYSGDPGSYKIFKRFYLLAEDYGKGVQPTFSAYCGPNEQSNYMRIGPYAATSPSLLQRANFRSQVQYVKTPRYWNDASNAATYAMVDYAGAYQSAAHITFAHRHFAHFKKPGSPEYVIVADSVRTTDGQTKVTFLHFPNNGQVGVFENGTTLWPDNPTEGITTFTQATSSVVSDSPASRILTKVLKPGGSSSLGVYVDNTNGSYAGTTDPAKGPLGGAGQTFRVSICGSIDGETCDSSNLKANVLAVHRIVDGNSETSNPAALIATIDPNFMGVQSDSVVALFPVEGATLSSATFSVAHSGTAQYLISGLMAGSWSIRRGGSLVSSSVAVDSSGVLYFEGTAGTYLLSREGAGSLAVATTVLPNAALGSTYSIPLAAAGGNPPYTWSVSSGSLPSWLTLSSGGLLSGTPVALGSASFQVAVTDASSAVTTQDLAITVGVSTLSVATASPLPAGTVGAAYSYTLSAVGGSGSKSWSATANGCSAWASLSSSGVISGTPPSAQVCSITAQVSDSSGSASKALSITVTTGSAPLAITTASLPVATEGFAYSASMAATGGSGSKVWDIPVASCPWLVISSAGALSGTPPDDGSCAATIRVTDSSGSDSKDYTITINPVTLGITVTLTPARTSALISYGASGLPSNQVCTIRVSQGGVTVFTVSDSGGRPIRRAAATGLSAGPADVSATCLPYGAGVASTTIFASSGQTAGVPVQGTARAIRGATKMKVEWGYTAAMSETAVVVSCTGHCAATLPGVATGSVIWTRISFLTAGNTVVATGATAAAIP